MPKTGILIEWLAFLLTAIAWIVFISLRMRNTSAEASREAGEKLCKWTGGYNKWAVAGSIFVLAVFALLAILSFRHFPSPDIATLSMLLNMTAVCVSFFPQRESLELCRNGIVIYRNGTRVFIPWKKMECMRISSRTGNVFIEETQWRRNPYRIPLIDVPAAIEVLRPLVMVRDADGRLLNLGFNPAAANLSAEADRRKWQFSLRSLLLLMVLASCTMSWYSIHHRHEVLIDQLLEKLRKFHPEDHSLDRTRLSFAYGSFTKPHDDDLKLIAEWPGPCGTRPQRNAHH